MTVIRRRVQAPNPQTLATERLVQGTELAPMAFVLARTDTRIRIVERLRNATAQLLAPVQKFARRITIANAQASAPPVFAKQPERRTAARRL